MGFHLEQVIEAAASPKVAVPVTSAGPIASVFDLIMPHIVTLGWLVYIAFLTAHTVWKWRRDWKVERDRRTANE